MIIQAAGFKPDLNNQVDMTLLLVVTTKAGVDPARRSYDLIQKRDFVGGEGLTAQLQRFIKKAALLRNRG